MNTGIARKVYWLVCLVLLGCTLANGSPIFEYDTDAAPQFTHSLPLQKWIGPEVLFPEHPFDFGPACLFTSGKDCFFKFFFKTDPPAGDDWFFGNDPPFPTVQGTDPDPVTPEPPAWTLLGLGLVGVALFRRTLAKLIA